MLFKMLNTFIILTSHRLHSIQMIKNQNILFRVIRQIRYSKFENLPIYMSSIHRKYSRNVIF